MNSLKTSFTNSRSSTLSNFSNSAEDNVTKKSEIRENEHIDSLNNSKQAHSVEFSNGIFLILTFFKIGRSDRLWLFCEILKVS